MSDPSNTLETHRRPSSRAFRPMRFSEVIGQKGPLTTLKNALETKTFAHAYLFSGPRGTGKTTLARLVARSLVCESPDGIEPCGSCPACIDAVNSRGLDVIEVDGASNRGIDEIRKINETVAYTPSRGSYKIYIIDEVHMLTKEAFNALLKTLEEPPSHVVFLFATTEPQKVPITILSRCQRLSLERLPLDAIKKAITHIAAKLGTESSDEAIALIAKRADGSLRDAQSLFDQTAAFCTPITLDSTRGALGIPAQDHLFLIDAAAKEGFYAKAYSIAGELMQAGASLRSLFIALVEHFRSLALIQTLEDEAASLIDESPDLMEKLKASSTIYSPATTLEIIDFLLDSSERLGSLISERATLEMALIKIIGSASRPKMDKAEPKIEKPPKTEPKENIDLLIKPAVRDETLMRFAAVELEGRLRENQTKGSTNG